MSRYREIDMKKVKTTSIKNRKSKVTTAEFARTFEGRSTFDSFYKSLPRCLAVEALDVLVDRMIQAYERKKPVILMMGAHVIKVGLNPVIVDLIEKGLLQAVARRRHGPEHSRIRGPEGSGVERARISARG